MTCIYDVAQIMLKYSNLPMQNRVDRRQFLRGLGISLALPMLESFQSPLMHASSGSNSVKRLVAIGTYLGFHQTDFFPDKKGKGYKLPYVLEPLAGNRSEFSILSGLDHRGRNGHEGWKAWLSGSATGSISIDQIVANQVGDNARYASLQVTCGRPPNDARISFTRDGVALPMIGRPSVLYNTLFRSDSDKARIQYILDGNGSVLDDVLEEARAIKKKASWQDQRKINEYLSSVRDVEKKLQKQKSWLDIPFPKTDYTLPSYDPISPDQALHCETIMYDLMALALKTDSTRVLTFLVPGWSQVFEINGRRLSAGYHGLSHHGNEDKKIAEYNLVGREHVKRFANFLQKLKSSKDTEGLSLLDSTAILYGSGMGDANTHDNSNLPTLVAGGCFKHGNHWSHQRGSGNQRLLGDLYLTLMQKFGLNIDSFAGAKNNLNECFS